jgi:hypothetical protein
MFDSFMVSRNTQRAVNSNVPHLITSGGTARMASMHQHNATDRIGSVEDIEENAWFVLVELITYGMV